MSYLSHLAARALGRTDGVIRPRLEPYFAPQSLAQAPATRVRELVETRLPATGVVSRQVSPGARSEMAPRAPAASPLAAVGPASPGSNQSVGRSAPLSASHSGSFAQADLPAAEPNLLPPDRPDAPVVIETKVSHLPAMQREAREEREGRAPQVSVRPDARDLAAPQPTVHIHIGRVDVRAVPAPQPAPASGSGGGNGRTSEKTSGQSLEEYLARSREGGA